VKHSQLEIADRNVRLYVFVKVFAKRVFLPLSAIYFVDQFGFSIREIGLLALVFAIAQLIAELPTGYFADRIARVTSIRIGALLNVSATLLYVFAPDKSWIFVAQILEAVGYSFLAGAGEALIHDSLVVRKDTKDYSKILSRAQSVSLIINAIFIALVPMTYRIDPRLPFLLGSLTYLSLFVFALFMHDVKREKPVKRKQRKISFKSLITKKSIIAFGLLFGLVGALYTAPNDMLNLAIRDFGMKPELLGWVYAAASICGAALGVFAHLLKRLSFRNYMILDSTVLVCMFIAPFTGSATLLAVSFIISIAFWRYRRIIYQDHLLTLYPTRYKATLLSAMSNVEQLNALWLPLSIALVVNQFGFQKGFGLVGLFALTIVPLYVWTGTRVIRQRTGQA
jgi:MFS family permease